MVSDLHVTVSLPEGESETFVEKSVDKGLVDKTVHVFIDDAQVLADQDPGNIEGNLKVYIYKGVTYTEAGETDKDYKLNDPTDKITLFEGDINIVNPSNPAFFLATANLITNEWVTANFDKAIVRAEFEDQAGYDRCSFDVRLVMAGNDT